MEKTELKELLRESTEKALFELGKLLEKSSSLYNELIILWKRHDERERNIRLGIVGHQDAGIESNQITNGLLSLIDKIEDKNESNSINKNEQKEILIEDAIDWILNALVGYNFTYDVDLFEVWMDNLYYEIENIEISKDNLLKIVVLSGVKESKNEILFHGRTIIDSAFQDIGSIFVKQDDSSNNIYKLSCRATNYKNVFKMTRQKRVSESINDLKEESCNSFDLLFNDYDFATKVKNAIDYLAIHFGRKEDAF